MWLLRTLGLLRDLWEQVVTLGRTETSIGPLPITAAAFFISWTCRLNSPLAFPPLPNSVLDELLDLRIGNLLRCRKDLQAYVKAQSSILSGGQTDIVPG